MPMTNRCNTPTNRVFLIRPIHAAGGRTSHAEEQVARLSALAGVDGELHRSRMVSAEFSRAIQKSKSLIR